MEPTTTYIIHNFSSHRNGVAGESFHAVDFTLTGNGESHRLIAILPSSLRDYDFNEGSIPCFVIDPADPMESHWRGDRIISCLRELGVWAIIDEENERRWQEFLNRGKAANNG